ncbi:MAG: hypothetical protein L6Q29_03575 [Candidatus Pacebacteria bacterium]|nr:hypothetical protein [Candidatus Paceibacterota bacterium]NUQ57487.1 hypothetical protein [Candidatus Paceibacter sp.]
MKEIKNYPPNYSELQRFFPLNLPDYVPLFPYGDILYNPSGGEIAPDVLFHEEIHSNQQKKFSTPEQWWAKYIYDRYFRLEQELEAYYLQWQFVKKSLGSKAAKECLEELSDNLSSPLYQLNLTRSQAKTKIRKYAIY